MEKLTTLKEGTVYRDNQSTLDKLSEKDGELIFDGNPISGSGLSDEQLEEFEANTMARHTHNNKSTLDKFGARTEGGSTRATFNDNSLAFKGELPSKLSTSWTSNILNAPDIQGSFLEDDILTAAGLRLIAKKINEGGGSSERQTETIYCNTDGLMMCAPDVPINNAVAAHWFEGETPESVKTVIDNGYEIKDISVVINDETISLTNSMEKDSLPFVQISNRPYYHHDISTAETIAFALYYPSTPGYLYTNATAITDVIITYYTD